MRDQPMSNLRTALLLSIVLLLAVECRAQQSPAAADPPRFTRHVVPVLSKVGCNAGACHGMNKGKGGFRLSLFGVNPQADHRRLLQEFGGRRVNLLRPEASLLLLKATARVPHGGGKRLDPRSADYRILRDWIAAGAKLDAVEQSAAERLLVTPRSRELKPGERLPLTVQAVFADGSQEDVTALCAYEVRDREVADVDAAGVVTTSAVGDTSVVIRYPGQVAITTLIVMPEKPDADFPAVASHNFIDDHILARLRLLGIRPSEVCDDATFLRRVCLDVNGRLPEPDEVREFLADSDPDKRTKKIDWLLEQPGYSALWATRFMDIFRLTGFDKAGFPEKVDDRFRGYQWLRRRLDENIPYDELAERILTATSREGRSYEQWADQAVAIAKEGAEGELPETYASRQTLDLFWQRRMTTDVDHAIRVGHSFLGLRLECAQCHRHPYDVWTQDDLLSFANFFMRVPHVSSSAGLRGGKPTADVAALQKKKEKEVPSKFRKGFPDLFGGREIRVLPEELFDGKSRISYFNTSKDGFATVTSPLGTQSSQTLRLLGEKQPLASGEDVADRRRLVMDWLRRPDNPYFAKAIVNRVWAYYLGRGIIDPPDDLSPLNPPSHPELLDELCAGFIASGYDLKWLHRTILASRTYQQSSQTNDSNHHERRNFASFYVRRLPAEIVLDAVDQATGAKPEHYDAKGAPMPEGIRLLEGAALFHHGTSETTFALTTLGRPTRDVEVVCDCERNNHATMLQALYLANHPQVREKVAAADGRVAQIAKKFSTAEDQITELFLASLGRMPGEKEMELCRDYLAKKPSPEQGLKGLMWSLLNSNEFLFNQ
jgi:hypothetical protein